MNGSLLVKIIYSAASIQGFFLAFMIFRTRVNQPANRILGVLLLLLSFHLILVGFDDRDFFMRFPHLSRVSWIIGSIYWPLIFLFVQYLTGTQPVKPWMSLWTATPFVVLLMLMLPYYLQSAEAKRALLTNFQEASRADFGWINQVVSLLHVFFMGFFLFYYLRFERGLREEYSEIESIRIKWLKQFLILLFSVTVVAVISFFARGLEIPLLSSLYTFHFAGVVFLCYWLSYKALTEPVVFGIVHHPPAGKTAAAAPAAGPEEAAAKTEKYRKSGLGQEEMTGLFERVRSTLNQDRLYLKPDLTLTELSEAAAIPRHQLSQVINSCYQGNFFDLVNDYRVDEFRQLAGRADKKHLSLLGIAMEAGFSSKATFYNVFRKKMGMTPSEYIEKQSRPLESSLN